MTKVIFGWDAPSIAEQFPTLSPEVAAHYQMDSQAISRLSIRGMLTRSERDKAAKRLSKMIIEDAGK